MPKLSFAALALALTSGSRAPWRNRPATRSEAPRQEARHACTRTEPPPRPGARGNRTQTAGRAESAPAAVAASAKEEAPKALLELKIEKAQLDNGLRVVMNVDHASPTVAVAVTYDVGARNEERGRSGFAHLFEHMMFQGSANVAEGRALQAGQRPRRHAERHHQRATAPTTSRCCPRASSRSRSGSRPTA